MKTFRFKSVIALLLLISLNRSEAQTTQGKLNQVSLANTEQFSITSKNLEGETYVIQVGLPPIYYYTQKSYPVLYVTDGNVTFPMVKSIADMLMVGKEIKDIIIVGISYVGITDADTWNKKRVRIFYPTSDTLISFGVSSPQLAA